MKIRLLTIIGIIGLSMSITPQSFGDNDFCNIQENLKIQEELIQDDIVLIEFLKVFPDAKLIRANFVEWSNPEQTSMMWNAGVYSLDIHILGFDEDNPSDCFVPDGYRLNAPHLPKMVGLDYHQNPEIVLEQIEELEPKYVKGGPPIMPKSEEPYTDPDNLCPPGKVFDWDICVDKCPTGQIASNGVCQHVVPDILDIFANKVFLTFFITLSVIISISIGFIIWRKRK